MYSEATPHHPGGRAIANSRWHIELHEGRDRQPRIDITRQGTLGDPLASARATKFPVGWRLGTLPATIPAQVGVEARKLLALLP